MNIGDCPYDGCSGVLALAVPERTPAYRQVTCPQCGREIWYRLSRVDPEAWTAADFEAEHEIDEEKRIIKRREVAS